MLTDLAAVTAEQLSLTGLTVPEELANSTIPLWRYRYRVTARSWFVPKVFVSDGQPLQIPVLSS